MSGTDRLVGKVALISGGARGMGASHARAITREGGQVVIGDILDDVGMALAEELGDAAEYVHLDVTSREDWDNAVEVAISRFGKLNVLVNNAGITNFGALDSYPVELWDASLAVNLTGPFLGTAAATRALKEGAPSSVINISSGSAFQGMAQLHGYTASKWGLRGLTKSVALELAADGVRVNSIHPGFVATDMIAGLELTESQKGPMGRIATPQEVSNLVVFLASDESSYSTGSEFKIDGGLLAGPMPQPLA
jgi:3alpha(or 20beta)-hydroxysteroid dehydrogenase